MYRWQKRIKFWMWEMVGVPSQWNPVNRGQRLLEEALEAVQCKEIGLTEEQCHDLVRYVYNRPPGVLHMEIGGVIVCLLAFADATGEDVLTCLTDEVMRIERPEVIEKVRAAILRKRNDGVGN